MKSFLMRGGAAVAVLILMSPAVSAQQSRAATDPRTVPELRAEFDRAGQLGLPVEPLVTKAREGYLKQASNKVIRDAVHDMANRMVRAREALKPVQSAAEVEAGAGALQAGVTEGVLRNLRAAQKARSIEVPLGVLTELVVRQVPLQQAAAKVALMLKSNYTDAVMIAFGTSVQGDVEAGVAPSTSLDVRFKGVLSLPQPPVQGSALSVPVRPPGGR